MNKSTLKGNWNQLKGSIKQTWGDLTDDDLAHIDGSFDKLVGKIQERYGHIKDEVETQVNEWLHKSHHEDKRVDDVTVNTDSTVDPTTPDSKV